MRIEAPHVSEFSQDIITEQIEKLKELFPEVVEEEKIDFDKLKATLGSVVDDRPERYSLNWAGKRNAIRMLQVPSRATLNPCPEESVSWETTKNIFIEGENLEVLKLLYKAYAGRTKLIYIDPPYNTGEDFVYPDDFADPLDTYLKLTGQKDAQGNILTSNPETSGRFHSSWLSMIYPRLFVARQLLREDGFIVISIDDKELHNLLSVANEVFGEENRIATLVWDRNRKNDANYFSVGHEYMLVYARNERHLRENEVVLRASKEGIEDVRKEFQRLRDLHGDDWGAVRSGLKTYFDTMEADDPRKPLSRFKKVNERGPYRDDGNPSWPGGGGPRYEVPHRVTGKPCKIPRSGWRWPTKQRFDEEYAKGYIAFGPDETTIPSVRSYLFEKATEVMRSVHYSYAQTAAQQFDAIFDGKRVFDNPKPFRDMARLVEYLTDNGDIALDFFAGSCSLGHGVLHANRKLNTSRRFICVQLPEPITDSTHTGRNALAMGYRTVADIGKERLRRVIAKFEEESKKNGELLTLRKAPEDLGFRVFKLGESNYRQWNGVEERDGDKYAKEMELFVDPLLPGWHSEKVIWEVAVKEGYGLSASIEQVMDFVADAMSLLAYECPSELDAYCEQVIEAGRAFVKTSEGQAEFRTLVYKIRDNESADLTQGKP